MLLILVVLIIIGCSERHTQPIELNTMNTYIVDSCEYVGKGVGGLGGILAHKGNCRFLCRA